MGILQLMSDDGCQYCYGGLTQRCKYRSSEALFCVGIFHTLGISVRLVGGHLLKNKMWSTWAETVAFDLVTTTGRAGNDGLVSSGP